MRLEVGRLPDPRLPFVLLLLQWVVGRSLACMARFRGLARDYERLAQMLASLHFGACATLLARRFMSSIVQVQYRLKSMSHPSPAHGHIRPESRLPVGAVTARGVGCLDEPPQSCD